MPESIRARIDRMTAQLEREGYTDMSLRKELTERVRNDIMNRLTTLWNRNQDLTFFDIVINLLGFKNPLEIGDMELSQKLRELTE